MGRIKPTQRIFDVVDSIRRDEYRLPSIQRSFVWDEDRICKLMDSIMNDYPIGSFLAWKPSESLRIRTRKFMEDFKTGMRLVSDEEQIPSSSYLILDGQQRLQSLYMGFFGRYDGQYLYFKVDSDPEKEPEDMRYEFRFLNPEIARLNPHWLRSKEIVSLKIKDIPEFVDRQFGNDLQEQKRRIAENLGQFIQVFNLSDKVSFQEVEEDLDYNDVLEVFVRANSGGIVLTKSDLVFSTIVLKIPDMEENFIELVDQLNAGGQFDLDTDFLIKTSFVIFDKGAKYDVRKLRDDQYVDKLKRGFDQFKASLTSTTEFLKTDAKILGQRFLKSSLALIPLADFVYHQPHQQVPEGQAIPMRQYLYMSFFTRFFSYGPDGKLDVIHGVLRQNQPTSAFPSKKIGDYIFERTYIPYKFSKSMLTDVDLVLNIITGGQSEIPHQRGWSLERDHIFPVSLLIRKSIPYSFIDDVGNLRLVNKTRNILKSDSMPDLALEFFGSEDPDLKDLFMKAREDLTLPNFQSFVERRKELGERHRHVTAVILTNIYPALSLDEQVGFRVRTELVMQPKPIVCLPRELRFPGDEVGTRWLPGVWAQGV